ncbi:MAG: exonuclease SbcCD subunit D [Clostridia bacterium]|nr:exonuclease SbcCD subunit D [Clostridia bacterium]
MKLIHLSDLHLGKRVHEFSLLEDQIDILDKILAVVDDERPEAVVIAGDIYDKAVPPAEAVTVFDEFLCRLAARRLQVFVLSGNHDSPERIAFGGRLMEGSGIHLSPVYSGRLEPVVLEDAFGPVAFYQLPFVRPAHVRRYFPEAEIGSYSDALRVALAEAAADDTPRKVLVTHQFVTGAARSESEEISVGGSDNVDAAVFDPFDYVALGHLHRPQNVGREGLRYCGTPLKYSFSEVDHQKSVTVAELGEKGRLAVRTVPLSPLREMELLRGSFLQLTDPVFVAARARDSFYHITLTDEEEIPFALGRLRQSYPNLMRLAYDNRRTRAVSAVGQATAVERRSPIELFDELYEKQNGQAMSEEQRSYLLGLIGEIWEGEA